MERSEILTTMSELKLYGMKAAYDEIIASAVKRQHEPARVVGDLLSAEIAEKQASRSDTRSPSPNCRWPRMSRTSNWRHADQRDAGPRPCQRQLRPPAQRRAGRGTGTGKTHLAIAMARALIRDGKRGRFFNVVELVNKLEAEGRAGRQGQDGRISRSDGLRRAR
jgi:hypothetical protein